MAAAGRTITPSGESCSGTSSRFEFPGDSDSINSSITTYRMENGRRYHGDGNYWAPNDDIQNDSLDVSHHLFTLMQNGRLYLAPLEKNISHALDIGTGTGIWAIDFADEFPDTMVIGTDLSPIQPSIVPPNCGFIIENCEDDWDYGEDYFDYIHIRSMLGCIRDWDALYAKAYKHLKPGGWIEHHETSTEVQSDDGTVLPDSPLVKFGKVFQDAGELMGTSFKLTDDMKRRIEATGYQNIQEYGLKAPLGRWPADRRLKEIGSWCEYVWMTGMEGWAMQILTKLDEWTPNEVQIFLAQVRAEAKSRRVHSYYNIKVVYGQKPYAATV